MTKDTELGDNDSISGLPTWESSRRARKQEKTALKWVSFCICSSRLCSELVADQPVVQNRPRNPHRRCTTRLSRKLIKNASFLN